MRICVGLAFAGLTAFGAWLLAPSGPGHSAAATAQNSAVPAVYQQARFFYTRRASGDLARAIRLYEDALRLEPRFAPAWVGLAAVYRIQASDGTIARDVSSSKRRFAVAQALRLEPDLASAHVEASKLASDEGDAAAATEHALRAVASRPDDPAVLAHLSNVAAWSDRMDDAIALARRVVALDPLGAVPHNHLANLLLAVGRFEEAEAEFAKESDVSMSALDARIEHGFTLILEHRFDEAFALIRHWPAGADRNEALAMIGRTVGRPADADAALRAMNASTGPDDFVRLAEVHAFRGELDDSFNVLQRARDSATRDGRFTIGPDWAWHLRFSPFLRPLHADPRWTKLRPAFEPFGVAAPR